MSSKQVEELSGSTPLINVANTNYDDSPITTVREHQIREQVKLIQHSSEGKRNLEDALS